MRRDLTIAAIVVTVVGLFFLLKAISESSPSPGTNTIVERTADTCLEPTDRQLGALEQAVKTHGQTIHKPWVVVEHGSWFYVAGTLRLPGAKTAIVLIRTDATVGQSVNGTAHTFTDLPASEGQMSRGGEIALDCVT